MKYGEAFQKLGYTLTAPRTDWTAENLVGVCISLWKSEIDWKNGYMDSREHGSALEEWRNKPGNGKRIKHATRAIAEFDGWVDVVVVDGVPGQGVTNAAPWLPNDRRGKRWRVTYLDDKTGQIRLDIVG